MGVDVIHDRFGRLNTRRFEVIHSTLHQALTFADQRLFAAFVPHALADHETLQAFDRFFEPGLLDLVRRPVACGIVGGGVVAEAIAQAFQQHRAFTVTRPFKGRLYSVVNREHVIAVDLFAVKPGANGFLCKPFTDRQLTEALTELLRGAQ